MNWYETAFGSRYLEVYSHRDEDEAARALELIEHVWGPEALDGKQVLDLACGQGRYSRLLAARGCNVAAVDLSMPLLERGSMVSNSTDSGGEAVWYVRADMRSVPFGAAFDMVINMFTSFGYFPGDEENALVIAQIASSLKSGGRWLIDYLNRPQVIATLVPHDESIRAGLRVIQNRRLEDNQRRVVKDVRIEGPEGVQQWTESVRMYSVEEMSGMIEEAGLELEHTYGGYEREEYSSMSPRLIMTGCKS